VALVAPAHPDLDGAAVAPPDLLVQVAERRAPAVGRQPPGPVHDVALQDRAEVSPARGEDLRPERLVAVRDHGDDLGCEQCCGRTGCCWPTRGCAGCWLPSICLAGAEAMIVPYLGGQGRAGVVLAVGAVGMAIGEFSVGRFASPGLRERLSLPLVALLGLPWPGFLTGPVEQAVQEASGV
jgi:hypothetical protein